MRIKEKGLLIVGILFAFAAGRQVYGLSPDPITKAWLESKFYERRYRENIKTAYGVDILLSTKKPDPNAWKIDHPSHQKRLGGFIADIASAPRSDTIAFGDSLLDMPRASFSSIPSSLNFAVSGSWAHHMAKMAADIRPVLERTGRYESIRYVVVGSLGGNPFLQRQPLDVTVRESLNALNRIRTLYPRARIIVFGIPPTVSTYVNLNAVQFEVALYQWVLSDRDAVILPLQRKFAGRFGLYPRALMSLDGVHFSPKGAEEFDALVRKAKTAPVHSIVD